MKNLTYIILIFFSLSSCTEIIDIELNSALQRIVIEAKVTDQDTPVLVSLSRTTDYFNPDEPEKVSGAKVSLGNDDGVWVNLVEMNTGIYQYSNYSVNNGEAYTLRVEEGDQIYEATSVLPTKVSIDSLEIDWFDSFNPNDSLGGGYLLNCWFKDPAGQSNFYLFTTKILNKIITPEHDFRVPSVKILMTDALINGKTSLMNLNRRGFYELGDTLLVELISIDQATYNYLDQIEEVSGGGPSFGSSAPANPENNISNGAMGYFSAQAIDSRVVIIR